jgi:acetyl esterase
MKLLTIIQFVLVLTVGILFHWTYTGMELQSYIFANSPKLFIPNVRPYNNSKDISTSRRTLDLVCSIAPGHVDMRLIDLGGGLAVYVFRPMNKTTIAPDPKDPLLPVMLWFHGGGFVEGSVIAESKNCQKIANTTGFIVVSIEYHLAPEHVFPAAVEDGMRALTWLFENARFYGGDRNKVFIGGESAGGNLAASTIIGYVTRETPFNGQILGYLAVYPCLDHGSYTDSHFKYMHANGMLTLTQMQWYWALYLGADQSKKAEDIRACPARAPDSVLRKFPQTYIILAEHDVLFDEGVSFVRRLKENNVVADYFTYPGTIHGFFGRKVFGSSGTNSLLRACDELKNMLPINKQLYTMEDYMTPANEKRGKRGVRDSL